MGDTPLPVASSHQRWGSSPHPGAQDELIGTFEVVIMLATASPHSQIHQTTPLWVGGLLMV